VAEASRRDCSRAEIKSDRCQLGKYDVPSRGVIILEKPPEDEKRHVGDECIIRAVERKPSVRGESSICSEYRGDLVSVPPPKGPPRRDDEDEEKAASECALGTSEQPQPGR
jgi:hypothetical protein